MKNTIVLIMSLALLSACSTLSNRDWSETIPPETFFIQHYIEDTDSRKVVSQDGYLLWIHRFYFGWSFYPRGWLQTTNEFVDTLNTAEEKTQARELMLSIAEKVAPEWAKDRSYRVINTSHLSIWGNALNDSVVHQQQIALLLAIQKDVKDLLAREITPNIITADRYFPDEEFGADLNFE